MCVLHLFICKVKKIYRQLWELSKLNKLLLHIEAHGNYSLQVNTVPVNFLKAAFSSIGSQRIMNTVVCNQVITFSKSFTTCLALIWAFSCVDTGMALKMWAWQKCQTTHLTLVALLTSVCQCMHVETCMMNKALATKFTLEGIQIQHLT
jgi:hypothetical protein